jgi:hypothetical protein
MVRGGLQRRPNPRRTCTGPCERGDGWSRRSRGSSSRAPSRARDPAEFVMNHLASCHTCLLPTLAIALANVITSSLEPCLTCVFTAVRHDKNWLLAVRISFPFLRVRISCAYARGRDRNVHTSLTVANVSRPSKTRSTLAAECSSLETSKEVLNAHSVSPTPVHDVELTRDRASWVCPPTLHVPFV